jgi:hypothetical protein
MYRCFLSAHPPAFFEFISVSLIASSSILFFPHIFRLLVMLECMCVLCV